jgi:glutathione synthase/RimK-type ligase-like ATP-grasp enzyme
MSEPLVLIVTASLDPHADAVIDALSSINHQVFRLNTEDLFSSYSFAVGYEEGVLSDYYGRSVNLKNLTSAYYRKPDKVRPHVDLSDDGIVDFSIQEGEGFLQCLYAHTNIAWFNAPHLIKRAAVKLSQLQRAVSLGFRVPKTLITNSVNEASMFAESLDYQIICKPIKATLVPSSDGSLQCFTAKPSQSDFEAYIDSVRYAPTLLQEWIPKKSEIRATVIGNKVFSCEIDSQSLLESSVDWRKVNPFVIPHTSTDLPDQVNNALIKLVQSYGMSFGAIDLILTPSCEYVFLENNPNGQWYWIELITGMPMADEMAHQLSNVLQIR